MINKPVVIILGSNYFAVDNTQEFLAFLLRFFKLSQSL